jgi:hypothetical protein
MDFWQTLIIYGLALGIISSIITIAGYVFANVKTTKHRILLVGAPFTIILLTASFASFVAKSNSPQPMNVTLTPTQSGNDPFMSGPTATTTSLQPTTTQEATPTATPAPQTLFKAKFGDSSNWNLGGFTLSGNTIVSGANDNFSTSPANYMSPADFRVIMEVHIFINNGSGLSLVTRSSPPSNGTNVEINGLGLHIDDQDDQSTFADFIQNFKLTQPFKMTAEYNSLNVTVTIQQGGYHYTMTETTKAANGGTMAIISHDASTQISSFEVQSLSA